MIRLNMPKCIARIFVDLGCSVEEVFSKCGYQSVIKQQKQHFELIFFVFKVKLKNIFVIFYFLRTLRSISLLRASTMIVGRFKDPKELSIEVANRSSIPRQVAALSLIAHSDADNNSRRQAENAEFSRIFATEQL